MRFTRRKLISSALLSLLASGNASGAGESRWLVSIRNRLRGIRTVSSTVAKEFNARAIPVSALQIGAIPANNFRGVVSPPGSVFQNKFWTLESSRYYAGLSANFFDAIADAGTIDQSVTTWTRNGAVVLRLDGRGNGLYFHLNLEVGRLEVCLVSDYVNGSGNLAGSSTGKKHVLATLELPALLAQYGYSSSNSVGQEFTFGCRGLLIYVQYNGATFWSLEDWRHVVPGAMAIQAVSGYGWRNTTFNVPSAQTGLYSQPSKNIWDARDFGLKTLTTVGSIAAGSNKLRLAKNPGFGLGDNIIVEIGGEDGAGRRGTMGVGGCWPRLSYTSFANLNADQSKPNGTYAYTQDTLVVYFYWNGWRSARTAVPTLYYQNEIAPKSMLAQIIAVDADTLTLSVNAVVEANNAQIYFDNHPVYDRFFGRALNSTNAVGSDWTLHWPPGVFAFSDTINVQGATNPMVIGSSRGNVPTTSFKSPKGTQPINMEVTGCNSGHIAYIDFVGNFRFQGFGLNLKYGGLTQGLHFSGSANSKVSFCTFTDPSWSAFSTSYCTAVWARDCSVKFSDGLQHYTQWAFQWTNSAGGGFADCSVTSPTLVAGFNSFASTGTSMLRCVGHNAVFALNASGGWTIDSPIVTISENSQYSPDSFSAMNPIFNINTNILNTSGQSADLDLGGIIRNPFINHPWPINADNDALTCFNVDAKNANIKIIADYYNNGGGTDSGEIILPGYRAPSRMHGALGVNSTGENTYCDGIRVLGACRSGSSFQNIALWGKNNRAVNCIADETSGSGDFQNILTNAEWAARGGK